MNIFFFPPNEFKSVALTNANFCVAAESLVFKITVIKNYLSQHQELHIQSVARLLLLYFPFD